MTDLLPHSPGKSAKPASVITWVGQSRARSSSQTCRGNFWGYVGVALSQGRGPGWAGAHRAVLSTDMPTAITRYEAGGWPERAQGWGAQPGVGGLVSCFYLLALTPGLQGEAAPCHPERGPNRAESSKGTGGRERWGRTWDENRESHRVRQNEAGGWGMYRERGHQTESLLPSSQHSLGPRLSAAAPEQRMSLHLLTSPSPGPRATSKHKGQLEYKVEFAFFSFPTCLGHKNASLVNWEGAERHIVHSGLGKGN